MAKEEATERVEDLRCPICGDLQTSSGSLRLHIYEAHDDTTQVAPVLQRQRPERRGFPLWAAGAAVLLAAVAAFAIVFLISQAADEEQAERAITTTSTTVTSTTAPPTTPPPPPTSPPSTAQPLVVGLRCELGSHPDCIDPDGDGTGTYLMGGGECIRDFGPIDSEYLCEDLDGDGYAGYPDSG